MPDTTLPVIDRITRAIDRIDAATQARKRAAERLAVRHDTLRARIGESVKALDALIGRGDAD